MITLETWLSQHYRPATLARYLRDITIYLQSVGEDQAQQARYTDIILYLQSLRKQGKSSADIACILQGIKKYYAWLLANKQRKDHPAKNIRLKDRPARDIRFQQLFNKEELETMLHRKERYGLLQRRNQLLISLLIYQALTSGELLRLEVKDLDLVQGKVFIAQSPRQNARSLALEASQVLTAYQYIKEDRPLLLENKNSPQLLINHRGTAMTSEDIGYLLETFRPLFPGRKIHAKIIRQSVIAQHLKAGKALHKVQAFAGHKYPGTTQRYRQSNLDELQQAIETFHPLETFLRRDEE